MCTYRIFFEQINEQYIDVKAENMKMAASDALILWYKQIEPAITDVECIKED